MFFKLLNPVELNNHLLTAIEHDTVAAQVDIYTTKNKPDIQKADIVIIGVEEERKAIGNQGVKYAPNAVRQTFYSLYPGDWHIKIVDLGNLKLTDNYDNTLLNLVQLLSYLPKNISVIIIGGSQDLSLGLTKFLENSNKTYNLAVIDAFIDSSLTDHDLDNENYLMEILGYKDSKLHNLSVLGVQTYLNHPAKYKIFNSLYLDYFKLGEIKGQVMEYEPELRDAEIASIDVRSIKYADMPAQEKGNPNGLSGLDICTLTRLAGIASKNKFLGIFEYNPLNDKKLTGANLIAQMMWYYIEGKNRHIPDFPKVEKKDLLKFYVDNELFKFVFYKNKDTNRWWVEIPDLIDDGLLFPCSGTDYHEAVKKNITKRIYRIINKLTV